MHFGGNAHNRGAKERLTLCQGVHAMCNQYLPFLPTSVHNSWESSSFCFSSFSVRAKGGVALITVTRITQLRRCQTRKLRTQARWCRCWWCLVMSGGGARCADAATTADSLRQKMTCLDTTRQGVVRDIVRTCLVGLDSACAADCAVRFCSTRLVLCFLCGRREWA